MRALKHTSAPGQFSEGEDGKPAERANWYLDIYKSDGKTIKDRWNSVDQDQNGESSIRRWLVGLSNGMCAWCEAKLAKGWHVDHWLPKTSFPKVCYYPDNFLPACPSCNNRKDAIVPRGLEGVTVVDPAIVNENPGSIPFQKDKIYPTLSDRLLDPSHDEPDQHIEFIAAAIAFRGVSQQGIFTVNKLLSSKDYATCLGKHHDWVRDLVRDLAQRKVTEDAFNRLIVAQIDFNGYQSMICAFAEHWKGLLMTV